MFNTIDLTRAIDALPRKWGVKYADLNNANGLIRPNAVRVLNEYAASLSPKSRERIRIANIIRDAGGPE